MIGSCFVQQEATSEIISNVTGFCAECYSEIVENDTIFYDMKSCRYICKHCQETLSEKLDMNCEPLEVGGDSLFS